MQYFFFCVHLTTTPKGWQPFLFLRDPAIDIYCVLLLILCILLVFLPSQVVNVIMTMMRNHDFWKIVAVRPTLQVYND